MSRLDWRRWLDVGAADGRHGAVALEVEDDGRLRLEVSAPLELAEDGGHATVRLDFGDAGLLLDWLREALGVQLLLQGDGVAGAAVAGLHASQRGAQGVSEPSDSMRDRG